MKNFLHKLLEAINKGVLMGLELDDNPVDSPVFKKDSDIKAINVNDSNYYKIIYSRKLQLMLPDPNQVTKEFIDLAIEWHREYKALYNPHLDGEQFRVFIRSCMTAYGDNGTKYNCNVDFNWIDTHDVTSMYNLFGKSTSHDFDFSGDISEWDTSNVEDMESMFKLNQNFNGNLSKWDTSNVKTMEDMFYYAKFDNDSISNWHVHNVETMEYMFMGSAFNLPLKNWDVSKVESMVGMFNLNKSFDQNISNWDVSNCEDFSRMFFNSNITQDKVSNWKIKPEANTYKMFIDD